MNKMNLLAGVSPVVSPWKQWQLITTIYYPDGAIDVVGDHFEQPGSGDSPTIPGQRKLLHELSGITAWLTGEA